MAFRRPVYFVNNGLRQMSDSQIADVQTAFLHHYLSTPSVRLDVVASAGNLGTINNTRLQHGSTSVSVVTNGFARISQTLETVNAPDTVDLPMYYNGTNLRVMSLQDLMDTFITPVGLINFNPYTISTTTTLTGYTLVSATPVFTDTRAIANTATSVQTIANYYLHRKNIPVLPTLKLMSFLNTSVGFKSKTLVNINTQLQSLIRHTLRNVTGSLLRYSYNGAGTTLGTTMVDTRLNSSTSIYIPPAYGSMYGTSLRAPSGSAITISNYALRGAIS